MADRSIRSLVHLENSASTARVLNLLSNWRRHKDKPDYAAQPFFQNKALNRAMILKHQVKRDELDLFDYPRLSATKVVFPVDPTDLKSGGKVALIGQRYFAQMLEGAMGQSSENAARDVSLLQLLDKLSSFDPFLLREELKRNGFEPAACYLELTEADVKKIFAFAQSEIEPLVRMSLGGSTAGLASQTAKLVDKLFANNLDSEIQVLRQVLRLNEAEFVEGMFCWKGFIYYKWVEQNIASASQTVTNAILQTMPLGKIETHTRESLSKVRTLIVERMIVSAGTVKTALATYDHAYAELTAKTNPVPFREFLLSAPARFAALGERLGVLQHITSFCQFRFPPGQRITIAAEELLDVFNDFEGALYVPEPRAQRKAATAH
jgi:hypothetical protein